MARIKVSEIVSQFLDSKNYGSAEYAKAYRIAIRGLRSLSWDVTGIPIRTKVEVGCDLTASVPEDCIKILSIGVINNRGEIATLTENSRLTGMSEDSDIDVSNTLADQWYMYSDTSRYLSWSPSLGIGSQTNIGEFRYDTGSCKVILNPEFCYKEIVIEYLSNKSEEDGEYYVNELASEALFYYLSWKWHEMDKNTNYADKLSLRREYYNELNKAKVRIKGSMLQTKKQGARRLTMSGIRS